MDLMELSKEQLDFLLECEEEFKNRYTDADEDFCKIKFCTVPDPPILNLREHEKSPSKNRRSRRRSGRSRRDSDRRSRSYQRRDRERYYHRHKELIGERHTDGRRKKQKRPDREVNQKSPYRRDRDATRSGTSDRKLSKNRRSQNKSRKRTSYRSEDRDRRYNDSRDREQSKDCEQKCRERKFEDEEFESKRKHAKTNGSSDESLKYKKHEQDKWNMYVCKHSLYENYRPYF